MTDPPPSENDRGITLIDWHLRYPRLYLLLLVFSAGDIAMTWLLINFGGTEANPVAERVIDWWGLNGMIVYKFVLVALFIVICEVVGAMRDTVGRRLAWVGVLIGVAPIVWSIGLLAYYAGF